MKTHVTKTPLADLVVVNIDYFKDERGFFIESWNKRDFAQAGLAHEFVQDSHSRSGYGVLRGLHYQDMRGPIVKLGRCTVGRALDVAVDLRQVRAQLRQEGGAGVPGQRLAEGEDADVFEGEGFHVGSS